MTYDFKPFEILACKASNSSFFFPSSYENHPYVLKCEVIHVIPRVKVLNAKENINLVEKVFSYFPELVFFPLYHYQQL